MPGLEPGSFAFRDKSTPARPHRVHPIWYNWSLCLCSTYVIATAALPTYLSDAHGAKDVQEDEGAISVVITHQVAVTQALQPRDGAKWQLGHHTPIKTVGKNNP